MDKTYEQGLLEGKMETLAIQAQNHTDRINGHEKRLRILERVAWVLVAIPATGTALIFFIQVLPVLVNIASNLDGL